MLRRPTMAPTCTDSQSLTSTAIKMKEDRKESINDEVREPLERNTSADPIHYQECRVPQDKEEDYSLSNILGIPSSHIRELCALSKLRHKQIVQCLGFQQDPNKGLCIIMEYIAGGTLQSLIKCFGAFEENVIRLYTVQILEGLEYLESCSVVHGDLKSANILISERGNVKLADFGTSHIICKYAVKELEQFQGRRLSGNQISAMSYDDKKDLNILCGTPLYMSPELIRTQVLTHASDIWALGCVVFEMATGGILPWREVHQCDPIAVIFHIGSHYNCAPSLDDIYAARAFMNPHSEHKKSKYDKQATTNAVMQNNTVSSSVKTDVCGGNDPVLMENVVDDVSCGEKTPSPIFIDFVKAMFTMNPARRPTATELLRHPFISGDHDPAVLDLWRLSTKGAVASLRNDSPAGGGNDFLDSLHATQVSQPTLSLPCFLPIQGSPELSSVPQEATVSSPTKISPIAINSTGGAEISSTVRHKSKNERDAIKQEEKCSSVTTGAPVAFRLPRSPVPHPRAVGRPILESPGASSASSRNSRRKAVRINRLSRSAATTSRSTFPTPTHSPQSVSTATPHKSLSNTILPRSWVKTKRPEMQTQLQWGSHLSGQDANSVDHSPVLPSCTHINKAMFSHGVASQTNHSSWPIPEDVFRSSSTNISNPVNDNKKECKCWNYPSYSPVFRSHVNYIRNQARRRQLQLQIQAPRLFESSISFNNASSKYNKNVFSVTREDSTVLPPPIYDQAIHGEWKQKQSHTHSSNSNSSSFTSQRLMNTQRTNTSTAGCRRSTSADGGATYHLNSPLSSMQTHMLNSSSKSPKAVHHIARVPHTDMQRQHVPIVDTQQAGILLSIPFSYPTPGASHTQQQQHRYSHNLDLAHQYGSNIGNVSRGSSRNISSQSNEILTHREPHSPCGRHFLSASSLTLTAQSVGRQPGYHAPRFAGPSGRIPTEHAQLSPIHSVDPTGSFTKLDGHPLNVNDPRLGVSGPVQTSSEASPGRSPQVVPKRKRRLRNQRRVTWPCDERHDDKSTQEDLKPKLETMGKATGRAGANTLQTPPQLDVSHTDNGNKSSRIHNDTCAKAMQNKPHTKMEK